MHKQLISAIVVDQGEVLLFSFAIIAVFLGLFLFAIISYRLQNQKRSLCPYTKKPLWRGEEIPLDSVEKIMHFLYYGIHNFDNRVFPLKKAMVCRDTGRIFQNCVSWWGFQKVGWDFLQKRYPGVYVSWGSLSIEQQREIRESHHSLEGFQTEHSSMNQLPKDVEQRYIYLKPGPLYVDIRTKILLGWKCVPDTRFEVLVVQKPIQPVQHDIDMLLQMTKETQDGPKNK